ncbi:Protocadherin alpha-7 [Takifugu flavidus]|uniref:Protocadherin alpha-7 n=1 Tax=Takifugu flavidus TaxID=433684 RepID=A0A5C6MK30_9TELE|nr:Protocadherin alpha-7 [Takifugu flavidus]
MITLGSVSVLFIISIIVLIAMQCSKSPDYTSKYLPETNYDGTLCHSIQYRSGDKRYMLVGPRMSIGSTIVPGSHANTLVLPDRRRNNEEAVAELRYSIPEETREGTAVGNVAKDLGMDRTSLADRGLRVVSGSKEAFFDVDADTGALKVRKKIDREETCPGRNSGSPSLSSNVTVKVFILDQNDNAPVILYPVSSNGSAEGVEEIPRNVNAGHLVTKVRAYDADIGYNGWLLFSLQQVSDHSLFGLDRYTGQIRTLRSFTETDEAEHKLVILVKDNGNVSLSATATVMVKLVEPKEAFAASDLQSSAKDDEDSHVTFYLMITLGSVSVLFIISIIVLIAMQCSKSPDYTSKYLPETNYDGTLCHSIQYRSGDKRYMLVGPRMSIGSTIVPGSHANTLVLPDRRRNNEEASAQIRYSVPEEVRVGTVVGNVAKDLGLDSGSLTDRRFRAVSGNEEAIFEVNQNNGALFVRKHIDREQLCQGSGACVMELKILVENPLEIHYINVEITDFQVVASDSGSPSLSSNVTVNVFILDQNDNAPVILYPVSSNGSAEGVEEIPRNVNAGHLVTKVRAYDADIGYNGWLLFSLQQVSDHSLFGLDRYTGQIRTLRSFTETDEAEHKLVILVKDNGNVSLSATATVMVKLVEPKEAFAASDLQSSAKDDEDSHVTFYLIITLGSVSVLFIISIIVLIAMQCSKSPDYTSKYLPETNYDGTLCHSIQYRSGDKRYMLVGPRMSIGSTIVPGSHANTLVLPDRRRNNEEAVAELRYSIPEETREGTAVGNVAKDLGMDRTSLADRGLRVVSGSKEAFFDVDADTGALKVRKKIDREETCPGRNSGSPSLSSNVTVNVFILDQNDNAPVILYPVSSNGSAEGVEEIPRNVNAGHLVTKVRAYDADIGYNGWLLFSLQQVSDHSLFGLDRYTGQIRTLRSFTETDEAEHKLVILVKDNGNVSLSATATVMVKLVEPKEAFAASDLQSSAKDDEDSHVTFYLIITLGSVSVLFIISIIVLIAMQCSKSPDYTSKYLPETNYDGTLCHSIQYRSGDKRYMLVGPRMSIGSTIVPGSHANTLVLPDRRRNNEEVRDCELLFILLFTVLLFGEQASAQIRYSVPEEVRVGTVVGNVAKDLGLDSGSLTDRRFRAVSGNEEAIFEVNQNNGALFVRKHIDREQLCQGSGACVMELKILVENPLEIHYINVEITDFQVVASDSGSPSLSSNVTVNVFILDQNDNAPVILYPVSSNGSAEGVEEIPRNVNAGHLVTKVRAYDADIGYNGWLLFSLQQVSDHSLFGLDRYTGQIRTLRSFTETDEAEHKLVILVKDNGNVSLSATATVMVKLVEPKEAFAASDLQSSAKDDEDSHVTFYLMITLGSVSVLFIISIIVLIAMQCSKSPDYTSKYLPETNYDGTLCHSIQYRSGDKRYMLVGPRMSIGSTIVPGSHANTLVLPDRRRNNEEFQVVASDSGSPSLSSNVTVNVFILDQNDNAPVILYPVSSNGSAEGVEEIPRNVNAGHLVTKVRAYDADIGYNGWLLFSLQQVSDHSLFGLDRYTGQIRTLRSFTETDEAEHKLVILVKDNGNVSLSATATVMVKLVEPKEAFAASDLQSSAKDDEDSHVTFYLIITLGSVSVLFIISIIVLIAMQCSKSPDYTSKYLPETNYDGTLCHSIQYRSGDKRYMLVGPRMSIGSTIVPGSHANTLVLPDRRRNNEEAVAELRYSIPEETREGTAVGNVAKDLGMDRTSLADRGLRVVSGSKEAFFDVDADTGALKVRKKIDREETCPGRKNGQISALKSFDFETLKTFKFQVVASDSGSPSLSSNVTVNVFILDQNDNAPVILYPVSSNGSAEGVEEIPRNVNAGHLVTKVRAYDADIGYNGWLLFSLQQVSDHSLFGLDRYTGQIRTLRSFTETDEAEHKLVILVKDNGNVSLSATATVMVKLVEPKEAFAASDLQSSAKDDEDSHVTFYLMITLGSVSVLFIISIIVLIAMQCSKSPDYTSKYLPETNYDGTLCHSIQYRSGDKRYMLVGPRMSIGSTIVPGSHANTLVLPDRRRNNEERAWADLRYSVPEEMKEGTVVGNVAKDLGLEKSSLADRRFRVVSGSKDGFFEVNPDNGALQIRRKIDREETCQGSGACLMELKIVVENPLEMHHIVVEITDVNDHSPSFSEKEQRFQIAEQTSPGTRFQLQAARDPDSGFQVVASDSGSPSLSSNVTVNVFILDQNDNAPVILYPVSSNGSAEGVEEIPRNVNAGHLVTKVRAYDADIGYNGWLLFSLQQVSDHSLFGLDRYTGQIRTLRSFTETDEAEHKLVILVKDNGNVSLSATATVMVKLVEPKEAFAASDLQSSAKDDEDSHVTFYLMITLGSVSVLFIISIIVLIAMQCSKSPDYTSKYLPETNYDGTLCHSIQYRSGDKRYMLVGPRMSIGSTIVPGSHANTLVLPDRRRNNEEVRT